jgi:hypothetical protein
MPPVDCLAHPGSPLSPKGSFRTAFVLGCAVVLLALVGTMFWYQDLRYSLPTPKPPTLEVVSQGAAVALPATFALNKDDHRPLLLHFFNPGCPCSRFNAEHVRELRERYAGKVRFIAVLQAKDLHTADDRCKCVAAAESALGSDIEAIIDDGGKIAAACGVYSTPQAVFLAAGERHTVLFRGNYNASRYCADPRTEFVRLALEAYVKGEPPPPEPPAAAVSYGCELPANVAAAKPTEIKTSL